MPELPEVETIRRSIRAQVEHTTVLGCDVLWSKTVALPSVSEFSQKIVGQSILEVNRRGKFIVLKLTMDSLLIHLRMSGDLLIKENSYTPAKHDRLILSLSGGKSLVFNDTRKFGRVWLVPDPEFVTGDLGPEPLDETFTLPLFHQILRTSQKNIKAFLLDQNMIAGMGNIYTDEALFLAGIRPTNRTSELNDQQIEQLHRSIIFVLQEGIAQNGASFDWVYRGGNFQNNFNVYQRENLECRVCGNKISKIKVSSRGTHFCSICQR